MNYNFKKLTPFKWFIIENFPFLEDSIDGLTNYKLFCKLGDEINKLIESQNLTGEQVKELTNAFNQLKDYVDNYFEGLDVQEEISNKLDELVADGTLERLINDRILKNKFNYYHITTEMTEDEIIEIIEKEEPKVIDFEKGEYTFSKRVYLTSNTIFYLNGSSIESTFTDEFQDNMVFITYKPDSTFVEYEGATNIQFYNGNINTAFAFMHNSNVIFDGIVFGKNITTHLMQIAGCRDFEIKNCEFNGTIINDSTGNAHELIQLETCTRAGQPYLNNVTSPSYNDQGNFNIKIHDNIFNEGDNVISKNYICIGNHSFNENNIHSQKNIDIYNNTFKTSIYANISILSVDGFNIYNNLFQQEKDLNNHAHIKLRYTNKNIYIYNNNFVNSKNGIIQTDTKQIENLNIFENRFNSNDTNSIAINISACQQLYCHDNEIKTAGNHIFIQKVQGLVNNNLNIYNNKINMIDIEANKYGILVYGGTDINIHNNIVNQNTNNNFIYINGATSYQIFKNKIFGNNVYYLGGIDINYSNIYDIYKTLYSGGATYTELTNQEVNTNFTQFNRLILTLHKTGSSAVFKREILMPYGYSYVSKFDNRTYPITMTIDGVIKQATFTITDVNKFSFSSEDGKIVLRSLAGYNETF